MQLILLIIALLSHPASLVDDEHRSCADPSTRAEVKAAVQDRLTALGLPRNVEALTLLNRMADAKTDQAGAVAKEFQSQTSLPGKAFKLCEVTDPSFDDPMFVIVLFIHPDTGKPSGLVINFGSPGRMAEFGDHLASMRP